MANKIPEATLRVEAEVNARKLERWLKENPDTRRYAYEVRAHLNIGSPQDWLRVKNAICRLRLPISRSGQGLGWHYSSDENAWQSIEDYAIKRAEGNTRSALATVTGRGISRLLRQVGVLLLHTADTYDNTPLLEKPAA